MKTLTTEEIAKATKGKASGHAEVTSVVIDNREVVPGCLFIAIKGEHLDGHQFIDSAVEAGAAAVMCHEDIKTTVPTIKVDDTTDGFLNLAKYYRETFDGPFVALTGSVGKTTTKEMIWCVLDAKYNAHKTQNNWNNEIGVPRVLTTMKAENTAAVVELGMNHKGEISRITKVVEPDMAVITNIGVSHIENLGSREGILAAKLEILEGMKKGSTLILNADNDMLQTVKRDDFVIKHFGIHEKADVVAKDIVYSSSSTEFCVEVSKKAFKNQDVLIQKIVLPTTGEHNVYDALAAITVGMELEIPLQKCADALLSYAPAGMREKVVVMNGVTVIEDCYNASPDSVKALASTLALKGQDGQRKIAVIADMLELGDYSEEAHRKCGEYLAKSGTDMLLTFGPLSKFTAASAKENGLMRVFDFDDKKDLTEKLISMLKPGDIVAFKGSRGMHLEEVIAEVYNALV